MKDRAFFFSFAQTKGLGNGRAFALTTSNPYDSAQFLHNLRGIPFAATSGEATSGEV
jgi:hypothetical protein